MSKITRLSALALWAMACAVCLTACSSDDDNGTTPPSPSRVWENGIPKSIAGVEIRTDASGKVTTMVDTSYNGRIDDYVTVSYEEPSSAPTSGNFNGSMRILEPYSYYGDTVNIYFRLNAAGYIEYAYQTGGNIYHDYNSAGPSTPGGSSIIQRDTIVKEWNFSYNSDNQLVSVSRKDNEGWVENTTLTYTDGNITRTEITRGEENGSELVNTYAYAVDISYDSSDLDNKGCIMLFDEMFGVDLEEMNYAYYAGLLGRATKKLPTGYGNYYFFSWEINSDGMPTKLSSIYSYYSSSITYRYFTW